MAGTLQHDDAVRRDLGDCERDIGDNLSRQMTSAQRCKICMSADQPAARFPPKHRKPWRYSFDFLALDGLVGLYAIAQDHEVASAGCYDVAEFGTDSLLGKRFQVARLVMAPPVGSQDLELRRQDFFDRDGIAGKNRICPRIE